MEIVVVGAGSIGTTHIKNLLNLGHDIYAVDFDKGKLEVLKPLVKGTFTSLQEALALKPDIAFICTFSNSHVAPAIECAEAGCHLFIEKPLSMSMEKVDELIRIVEDKGLITMVGCNMRFHPAVQHIHETLENNDSFSNRLWADLEFGFYLPFAKNDYEKHYMANRSMGGNLIFDVIHELDYAMWFFGEPSEVICTKGILSDLKIDTEDFVDMIVKFRSGVVCSIHLDYLQHGYSRRCKVVCDKGTVFWDFSMGKIGKFTVDEPSWLWTDMNVDMRYNKMYLDEINYFIQCIENKKGTFNSVRDASKAVKLALAANKSAGTGKWESVQGDLA